MGDVCSVWTILLRMLIKSRYCPPTIDLWRTRQSAENLMAGLYGIQRDSSDVPPPVLQIHTFPEEIDYMTINSDACPQVAHLKHVVAKNSPVMKRLQKENAGFRKALAEILEAPDKPWSGYMDTVMPRVCHGYPLQCRRTNKGETKCLTSISVAKIMRIIGTETAEENRDAKGVFEVLRLGIGPLVTDIKQNLLQAKAKGKVRLSFYSGHDTTLSPLLGVLDSVELRWPPYVSLHDPSQAIVQGLAIACSHQTRYHLLFVIRPPTCSLSCGQPPKTSTMFVSSTMVPSFKPSQSGAIWNGVLWRPLLDTSIDLFQRTWLRCARPVNKPSKASTVEATQPCTSLQACKRRQDESLDLGSFAP